MDFLCCFRSTAAPATSSTTATTSTSTSTSSTSSSSNAFLDDYHDEKLPLPYSTIHAETNPEIIRDAARIVTALVTAQTKRDVDVVVDAVVHDSGNVHENENASWKESIAAAVLERLVVQIQTQTQTTPLGDAVRDVAARAREIAPDVFQFADDHPELVRAVALAVAVAVVAALLPWVLEAVGFGEMGPIAGSVAARLQARYMGFVPKGSWFSFFQRLGMIWPH